MSKSQIVHEGGCHCGKVRYRATGDPVRVTNCYCTQCARAAGAPFVTWVEFPVESVVFPQGPSALFKSSEMAERGFCPACGTALTYQYYDGGTMDLSAVTLDDPEAFPPQDHIHTESKPSWHKIGDDLPQYRHDRE